MMEIDLATQAGIAVAVGIIIQAIKALIPASGERAVPLASLALGMAVGGVYYYYQQGDPIRGAIMGFFGGAAASGLYDAIRLPTRKEMRKVFGLE